MTLLLLRLLALLLLALLPLLEVPLLSVTAALKPTRLPLRLRIIGELVGEPDLAHADRQSSFDLCT